MKQSVVWVPQVSTLRPGLPEQQSSPATADTAPIKLPAHALRFVIGF